MKLKLRNCFETNTDYFWMFDFDQQEYRLMLDYAAEMPVIEAIKGGLDVHSATEEVMEAESRFEAKTINFMLLYGGGVAKLCQAICKPTFDEATLKEVGKLHYWKKKTPSEISALVRQPLKLVKSNLEQLDIANGKREKYFTKLPKVKKFVDEVIGSAKANGFIFNWYGRRYYFDRGWEYKAPNHLIQGGCADIVKISMVEIFELLQKHKSKLRLQVHDEFVISGYKNEQFLIPQIIKIMEGAYPYKHLPLTVGIEFSTKKWGEKTKWIASPRGK